MQRRGKSIRIAATRTHGPFEDPLMSLLTRRLWSPSAAVLLFASAVTAVPLAYRLDGRQQPAPDNPQELARQLRVKLPDLTIVVDSQLCERARGFYLTSTAKDHADLARLPRCAERIDQWQGIVYCKQEVASDMFTDLFGDYYFSLPPFVFFGDRNLLNRIAQTLQANWR